MNVVSCRAEHCVLSGPSAHVGFDNALLLKNNASTCKMLVGVAHNELVDQQKGSRANQMSPTKVPCKCT